MTVQLVDGVRSPFCKAGGAFDRLPPQELGAIVLRELVERTEIAPRDVDCARAHGCRSLAVATGSHREAELAEAGADLVLSDLADTARVLGWLGLVR